MSCPGHVCGFLNFPEYSLHTQVLLNVLISQRISPFFLSGLRWSILCLDSNLTPGICGLLFCLAAFWNNTFSFSGLDSELAQTEISTWVGPSGGLTQVRTDKTNSLQIRSALLHLEPRSRVYTRIMGCCCFNTATTPGGGEERANKNTTKLS